MPFLANDITIYDDKILDVLDTISNRRKIPHDIVQRAQIILLANKGCANSQIGKEVGLSRNTVSKWRNSFILYYPIIQATSVLDPASLEWVVLRILWDLPRKGAPRKYTDEQIVKIHEIACRDPKECGIEISNWTHVDLADYCNKNKITESISPRTVGRYLEEADIKPHLVEGWLHSTEKIDSPETFATKANEICETYRYAGELAKIAKQDMLEMLKEQSQNPDGNAVEDYTNIDNVKGVQIKNEDSETKTVYIICTDEMTGLSARERVFEDKPVAPGMPAKHEVNYIRHGTTSFTGFYNVIYGTCVCPYFKVTRTETDFADAVSKLIEKDPDGYWTFVCDNLNTHKSETLVRYIAHCLGISDETLGVKGESGILKSMESRAEFLHDKTHRIRFVYTPKHCSWLDQIEIWFGILNRRLLKRASYKSVQEMIDSIRRFIVQYNITAEPFKWTYRGVPLSA